MRILIVDDNESLVEALRGLAEDAGDAVRTCTSGEAALRIVDSFVPQVVLLDLAMPGKDGLDVCRTLRANPTLASVKIIAISGFSDSEMRRQTAEAGFDLHLRKPISMDSVLDMLDTIRVGVSVTERG